MTPLIGQLEQLTRRLTGEFPAIEPRYTAAAVREARVLSEWSGEGVRLDCIEELARGCLVMKLGLLSA